MLAYRQIDFNTPLKSLDAAFESSHMRGQIAGLMAAKGLPGVLLADIEEDIQTILVEEREEKRNAGGTSEGS